MRLDIFLFQKGYVKSRTEAKDFISGGVVQIDGKVITKPSYEVLCDSVDVSIDKGYKKYVSRGGLKLEEAIKKFEISVKEKIALDVGASSGGFTDCLLQHGAKCVLSVDSGSGQLADSIRNDTRVFVYENFNARYMSRGDFEHIPDVAVMDVSFISSTYIIPAVYECLKEGGDFVCLIKPQFEVGRAGLGKGGIVKSEKNRKMAVDKVVDFAKAIGFTLVSVIQSPIKGGDGNIEYLAHFKKTITSKE